MPSPHTWITLSDKIYKLLCDWNFEFKLTSITLDNASSIDAFINILRTQLNLRNAFLRKGQFFHIIYCAHILNLIVQKGLKVMDESVKVRESVKYIKGSQVRKEKFKECIAQEALNNSRGLRKDVPTRWNSTYQCLIVHFTIVEHFSNWKQVIRTTNTLLMKRNETKWREYAIKDMNYVAKSLATKMKPMFDKYWADYNTILAITVVFDPRYKLRFVEFCYKMLCGEYSEQITNLTDTLKELFDLYKNKIPTYTVMCECEPETSIWNEGSDLIQEFDSLDNELCPAAEKTELDRFLEEKRLNRNIDINILKYCNLNQFRFPNLALMARDILAILISTVASKSTLSTRGRVLDQYRSCLGLAVVESLICTRDWRFNEKQGISNLSEILNWSCISMKSDTTG